MLFRSDSVADGPKNSSSEPSTEAKASKVGNRLRMTQNDSPAAASFKRCTLLRAATSRSRASADRRHPDRSGVVNRRVLLQLVEPVPGVDLPDGSGFRTHHQRTRRGAIGVEVHAPEQLTV